MDTHFPGEPTVQIDPSYPQVFSNSGNSRRKRRSLDDDAKRTAAESEENFDTIYEYVSPSFDLKFTKDNW